MCSRNRFVALAELASRENWCWRIGCTTCGHSHFRHALKDLANGRDPDSPEWRVHANRRLRDLGPLPTELSGGEQQALIDVVSQAGLGELRAVARWPDWLGYLGLVLHYAGDAERERRRLTKNLIPQFLQKMQVSADCEYFKELLDVDSALSVMDLTRVERAMSPLGRG